MFPAMGTRHGNIATGFFAVMNIIDAVDAAPTAQVAAAVNDSQARLNQSLAQWTQLQTQFNQLKGK